MTQSKEKADSTAEPEKTAEGELDSEELERVSGGIALLVPAVQKVREATKSTDALPTESISINFTKIEK